MLLRTGRYQVLACVFFAAMSLKSRVFAILDARRPELGSDLGNKVPAVATRVLVSLC